MAENSVIISAEEEAKLLKPIDEYVEKIQKKIDALRVDGSDKVNDLTNLITVHLSYIVTDVTSFPIPVFVHIWQRIMRRLWNYADGFVRPKHITQWF